MVERGTPRYDICPSCGGRKTGVSRRCVSCCNAELRTLAAHRFNQRFWQYVDARGDCWEWTGYRTARQGYGRFQIRRNEIGNAHRMAYELLVGPIPPGLTLDHLCRNTGCVNPDHLEPVTVRENVLRGYGPTSRAIRRLAVAA